MKLAMQTLERRNETHLIQEESTVSEPNVVSHRPGFAWNKNLCSAGFGPVWADVRGTSPFCLRPGLGKANTMSLPSPKSNPTLGVTLAVKMARVFFFGQQ